nr:hypothetical protein [Tautonia marina]
MDLGANAGQFQATTGSAGTKAIERRQDLKKLAGNLLDPTQVQDDARTTGRRHGSKFTSQLRERPLVDQAGINQVDHRHLASMVKAKPFPSLRLSEAIRVG